MEVLGDALPALYGCKDKEEVVRALDDGTLTPEIQRFNARGVMQCVNGIVKIVIPKTSKSPLVGAIGHWC